jgi:FAD/FMN-containing dehydrogenase
MDKVDTKDAAKILAQVDRCTAPMRAAQIRVLGGAAARVPVDSTAYAHRHETIMMSFLAMDGSPEAAQGSDRWAAESLQTLRQNSRGAYVNFLAAEGPDRLLNAYPGATWNRLRQIKRRYDPENLFRLNQNIPPA